MAWSTPRTWTTGELVTAAIMNAHVRDNFNETGPAKVTTAGDLLYASAANALARLGVGGDGQFLTLASGLPAWGAGLPLITPKTANETVTSSTTLQNDDHFSFAIGASEKWAVRIRAICNAASPGGFKYAFSVPAGATGYMGSVAIPTPVGAFSTAITTGLNAGVPTGAGFVCEIDAVIVNSTTAGTVQFQWAQNTSNATGTILIADLSTMQRLKIA